MNVWFFAIDRMTYFSHFFLRPCHPVCHANRRTCSRTGIGSSLLLKAQINEFCMRSAENWSSLTEGSNVCLNLVSFQQLAYILLEKVLYVWLIFFFIANSAYVTGFLFSLHFDLWIPCCVPSATLFLYILFISILYCNYKRIFPYILIIFSYQD
jgi:hypothetical protein